MPLLENGHCMHGAAHTARGGLTPQRWLDGPWPGPAQKKLHVQDHQQMKCNPSFSLPQAVPWCINSYLQSTTMPPCCLALKLYRLTMKLYRHCSRMPRSSMSLDSLKAHSGSKSLSRPVMMPAKAPQPELMSYRRSTVPRSLSGKLLWSVPDSLKLIKVLEVTCGAAQCNEFECHFGWHTSSKKEAACSRQPASCEAPLAGSGQRSSLMEVVLEC